MSEASTQSSTSPQKRQNEDSQLNDVKRPKTVESTSTNFDNFDINDLGIPKSDSAEPSSSLFKIDNIPLVPTTASSQPSASTSAINTPALMNLELPTLPAESPSTANLGNSPSVSQPPQSNNNNIYNDPANNKKNAKSDNDNELQKPKGPGEDPDKLSDALLSAGVDLKAEEALLASTMNNLPTKPNAGQEDPNAVKQHLILNTPFLDPRQLAVFMNKVANANGVKQSFENDSQILQLMTSACEQWMSGIVTNAVLLSRHRRRSIKQRRRGEVSKALRDLAVQQKAQEDRRQQKRKNLGIDQEEHSKLGTEETQHKATNATVAMMTAGKKKKYSWMTGGSGSGGGTKASSGSTDGGIRFREAREEPGIAVRDLLRSLEKKRMGVEKVITKGYSKLKD